MRVLQSEVGKTSFPALVGLGKQIVDSEVQQEEGRKSTQVVLTDAANAASRAGNEQRASKVGVGCNSKDGKNGVASDQSLGHCGSGKPQRMCRRRSFV